jgi:SpoIID/LytB domain protein
MIPKIEIGIVTSDKIEISFYGTYMSHFSGQMFTEKCEFIIENDNIILKTDQFEFEFDDGLTLSPLDFENSSCTVKDVVIGIGFHWEQKEIQKFQGDIKLMVINGKIQLINILPIENYLYSVISSEMNGNNSLELLKAHAIISRSWLLAQIDKQKEIKDTNGSYSVIHETDNEYIRWYDREDHKHFHVCADDHCQRYQGTTRAHNQNVIKAVQETEGIILMGENNKIADARFSKSCGGVTEIFENCWEPINHSYLKSFPDLDHSPIGYNLDFSIEKNAEKFINENPESYCNTTDDKILSQVLNDYDHVAKNNFYRWTIELTQEEISKLINTKSAFDFGNIIDLIPVERGNSARLIKLKIIGSKLTKTIGKELEIRRILSESHLYSSAFTIQKEIDKSGIPSKFILHGAGWGHGVGLCQIGAAVMSEKGFTYKEILAHYFRGAYLNKKY